MNSDATLNGRALAQTAVSLISNTVTAPTPVPEPGTLALLAFGSLAMLRHRRTSR